MDNEFKTNENWNEESFREERQDVIDAREEDVTIYDFDEVGCAKASKGSLVFGILSSIFACSYFLSCLGVIFGIIALCKGGKTKKMYRPDWSKGQAVKTNIGEALGIVGIILGIILTILCAVSVMAMLKNPEIVNQIG